MIGELLKIGDIVSVTIPKENRDWGYNPCEDGDQGEVTSFGEIDYGYTGNFGHEPGIYVNRSSVTLKMIKTGEPLNISAYNVNLLDPAEEKVRDAAIRLKPEWYKDKERIRDLPETKFWPGDRIKIHDERHRDQNGNNEFVVVRINYSWMNNKCDDGSPYPFYDYSDKMSAGWHSSIRESDMSLVSRGNVWKHYHNEPVSFEDLKEEADFYSLLGHTTEVRNPANHLYSWTKDEALQAIRDGLAHVMSVSGGLFGGGPHLNVIRYNDEELGKRLAEATLKGFGG